MMGKGSAYITVDVDVCIDEFDDQDLVEELESRGYTVLTEDDPYEPLTKQEVLLIMDKFSGAKPGTDEYEIYEKMRTQL
jgi:hypothetical protein